MLFSSDYQSVPLWQVSLVVLWVTIVAMLVYDRCTRTRPGTALSGPPSPSWLFGLSKVDNILNDPATIRNLYDGWIETYGSIFCIPYSLGYTRVILTDPKAIAHYYSALGWTYVLTNLSRVIIEGSFGRGLLWAQGEIHKRQRAIITPAFNSVSIQICTSVFYDSAYKLKNCWDAELPSLNSVATIDVQKWMDRISLDNIGIAGFSHDFGSLDGKNSAVTDVLDALGRIQKDPLAVIALFFGNFLPFLWWLPANTRKLQLRLNQSMEDIAVTLIKNAPLESKEFSEAGRESDKSIMGLLLLKGGESGMAKKVIVDQIKEFILVGYETTSICLTWALIELARNLKTQDRLRSELEQEFPNSDPTFDQLTNGVGLRYLDGVVHEILRLHPPLDMTTRIAAKDDVIPLSEPLRTSTGELVDHVVVTKGQEVIVPIGYINTSTTFWGADARQFRPERWFEEEGIPRKAQEIHGHRHLLTFIDGQKMCVGRVFVVAEFKAVLGVLIKNYTFELPNGPDTKIEQCRIILPRPRVAGEKPGANVPMHVRRVAEL